jgi:lipoate-protein ligase A
VQNIFSSLPSGGVMIFLDNNNYQTTYVTPETDLYDDLAKLIKSIDNSKSYHISTGQGFTVLIKD